ncbi:MAG: rod shape-determining protein, partial [Candidatus Jacksonbacteria bacterium]|nr:rod shape-determining protein [Candidatus Jacksonbacteria bacterium]
MINKLLGRFSTDMGIDLGTSSTLVYVKDKGIVINEPSLTVLNTRTDQIVAVGEEAQKMLGKTP